MRKPRGMSDEDFALARSMAERGLPARVVEDRLGVKGSTLSQYVEFKAKRGRRVGGGPVRRHALALRHAGYTATQVAELCGVSRQAVAQKWWRAKAEPMVILVAGKRLANPSPNMRRPPPVGAVALVRTLLRAAMEEFGRVGPSGVAELLGVDEAMLRRLLSELPPGHPPETLDDGIILDLLA